MADIKLESNVQEVMDELLEETRQARGNMRFTIFRALTLLEAEILENIRHKSGLHVRSGSLLNSIGASKKIYEENGALTGEIGPEGIPYAAIHEFGGTTPAHIIRPRNKKALKFTLGGKEVFARFVNHPGSKIPARPYLRPALAAKQDEILNEFGLFLKTTFKVD